MLVEEGDLTRLLPRLRVGKLDPFVGRLEPAYAAPDLDTGPLLQDGMCPVCHPDHPLTGRARLDWAELACQHWGLPPPWASSRAKLIQVFYRHRLEPPADNVGMASFQVTFDFVRRHGAMGFLARTVAERCRQQGLLHILPISLRIELTPVGLITPHDRPRSPTAEMMLRALRDTALAFSDTRDAPAPAAASVRPGRRRGGR